jgi:hypothetical protein
MQQYKKSRQYTSTSYIVKKIILIHIHLKNLADSLRPVTVAQLNKATPDNMNKSWHIEDVQIGNVCPDQLFLRLYPP